MNKSREERCKHRYHANVLSETEELGKKPLRRLPSGNRSTRQSVRIHGLARDPSSLIYPMYLSPPSSYSNKTSQNLSCRVLRIPQQAPCCIYHPWLLPMLSNNTKTSLNTLKRCGKCLGYQPLNGMEMERYELRKSTSLCVEIYGYDNL